MDPEHIFWAKVDKDIVSANASNILYSAPYFLSETGEEIGVTNYFLVQLKSSKDYNLLEQFALENNVTIVDRNERTLWCTLACGTLATENALQLATKHMKVVYSLQQTSYFHGLDNLNYVYLSSQSPWIVGAASNPAVSATSGYFLSSAISTLPGQTPSSKGKIVIRCVNNSNTGYIPVAIGSGHKSRIQNICNSKYWTLVWDSGIN